MAFFSTRTYGSESGQPTIMNEINMTNFEFIWGLFGLFFFVWFGLVWFGRVWFGLVWFGMFWFDLLLKTPGLYLVPELRYPWFGLVWFGLVLYGLVWFGLMSSRKPQFSI